MTDRPLPARLETIVARNPGPLTLDGSRTYVLGAERVIVIDPGPALADHLDAVVRAVGGAGAVVIALTHGHPDHAAAAGELGRRLDAPIAATPLAAEMAGLEPPPLPLSAGTVLEFDGGRLAAVSAPGHSPDHVCFHWPEAAVLFSGDVMLGAGTSMIAPPEGDMTAYLETLERLRALNATVIFPGHGPPIEDPGERIGEYLRHRLERESQVLEALAAGARTAAQIRTRVYPDLEPALHWAAEGSVRAHLDKLVREGRVRRDGEIYASGV